MISCKDIFFRRLHKVYPIFIAPFTENVFLPSDEVFDRSLAYLVLLIVRCSSSGIVPIVGIAIGLTQWLPSFFLIARNIWSRFVLLGTGFWHQKI